VTVTPNLSTSAGPATARLRVLRELIRADPHHGLQALQDDPGLNGDDIQILLAETYQQLGQHQVAHTVAGQAVAGISRADLPRLLAGHAVLADLACRLGGTTAVTSCHNYARLGARQPDPTRILLAGAVYAVASYNYLACVDGGTRLARLLQLSEQRQHRTHPVAVAILHAYTTMNYICRHRRHPHPGNPAALPGGLLTPDLTELAPTALSHLLRHNTITHRCVRARR
jgi:hypothetical protein